MPENGLKCLEQRKMAQYSWTLFEMARPGWNGWKQQEGLEMAGNDLKWLELAGNG